MKDHRVFLSGDRYVRHLAGIRTCYECDGAEDARAHGIPYCAPCVKRLFMVRGSRPT